MPTLLPFGTWPSPIQASDLVEGALALAFPTAVDGGAIWQEGRPAEGGRVALVRWDRASGEVSELLPADMSARTTVHEYGGRSWAVAGRDGRVLVTSNFADQRLWDVSPGRPPCPLTPEPPMPRSVRFACPVLSPDAAWVVAVRERHLGGTAEEVVNDLVAIALDGSTPEPVALAGGHDFYSSPTFSADGAQLAFVCWDHPEMPWDRTQLWRGRWGVGELLDLTAVVGGDADESVVEPQWSADGDLFYLSDRTGWWNIYKDGSNLAPMDAEFSGPAWTFGNSQYVLLDDGTIVATWRAGGRAHLGTVAGGTAHPLELPYTSFAYLSPDRTGPTPGVLALAGGPTTAAEIVDVTMAGAVEVLRRSRPRSQGEEWISTGEAFSFATGDGEKAHGIYYAPVNPDFTGPAGERPPLLVTSHGGPTGAASRVLDLATQFWTTRGFAVVDVDYRGSTGYGRAFRKALYGVWGLADVEDCAAAAASLADNGKADARRMVIRGGSASGLTVLAALGRHRVFAAGAVRFPVADIGALAATTHKFESRYMERLVPPSEYDARSPLGMVASISAPVLFLQGLDDKIVPPAQSRDMVLALNEAGTRALLIEIEGESHGFRRAATVVRALEAELAFFSEVLGLEPRGDLDGARADLAAAALPGGTTWAVEPAPSA